jgi:hypothetical protein
LNVNEKHENVKTIIAVRVSIFYYIYNNISKLMYKPRHYYSVQNTLKPVNEKIGYYYFLINKKMRRFFFIMLYFFTATSSTLMYNI